MASNGSMLGQIVGNLLAAALMIVLAVVSFFVTVFVVDVGAGLAGYGGNEYVVLGASILAGAAIIAGGVAPIEAISGLDRGPEDPLQ